jgi:hypothetical protein
MNLAARGQALWRLWLDEKYASPVQIARLVQTVEQSTSPCVHLTNFWQIAKWERLREAVEELTWERLCVLQDGNGVRAVDEAEFDAAPSAFRFSCHERAVRIGEALNEPGAISTRSQATLREFFAFAVLTPALAAWVSEVVGGLPLKVGSLEFSRYRAGDFIAPHDDCVGTRRFNLVSYLDDSDELTDGGALRVEGNAGLAVLRPQFNSAVLLPLAATNRHWVEPWQSCLGRRSVSISFVDAR